MMLAFHRHRETWTRSVDAYIALTQFSRDFFVTLGLPHKKIHVKPNFVQNPTPRTARGSYALFVGRLSPEKGVLEMLRTWLHLPHIPLVVVGDGPLYDDASLISSALRQHPHKTNGSHEPRGYPGANESALAFSFFPAAGTSPSGMALIEAAAVGVPAIAARIAGIPELVLENETGLLFDLQKDDLAAKVRSGVDSMPLKWKWWALLLRHPFSAEFRCQRKMHESELINVYPFGLE